MTTGADPLDLLADSLRKTMAVHSGAELDTALAELGWLDLLDEIPETAMRLVFGTLGETGAHAPVINDVVLRSSGAEPGDTLALPFAGGSWVLWSRDGAAGTAVDGDLPIRRLTAGEPVPLAAGRRALGWWLVGAGRAMLALARRHALDRKQFGKPIARFQAVRHRLAETLVALDGAEATLDVAAERADDLSSLLAKAAAGQAALTAARHCQQVLGGIGFTAEHELHHHIKRALVLDGLLGSCRELTREAGAALRAAGSAPRLAEL